MALESVQTYEVNGDGILTPIPNFIFQTDSSGSAILGGCCSNIEYTDSASYPLYINTDGGGNWNPYGFYGTSSTIAAGSQNLIDNGTLSFIGGGQENFISGSTALQYRRLDIYSCTMLSRGSNSFIGGGTCNTVLSPKSVIAGGHNNCIKGYSLFCCSTPEVPISISYPVEFSGEYITGIDFFAPTSRLVGIHRGPGYNSIVGGRNNTINGIFSFIGGGNNNNIISSTAPPYMISQYSGQFDFIGGGCNNTICDSKYSSIVGGNTNNIYGSDNSSMLGGNNNSICARVGFLSNGWGNTVGGGLLNKIIGGCGQSIFGGTNNTVSGAYSMGFSAIIGGVSNFLHSPSDGFPGGLELSQNNIILGGACHKLGRGLTHVQKGFTARSSIIHGFNNTLYGSSSNIIGSEFSCINNNLVSIFGGRNISGHHYGATIIGDGDYNRQKITAGDYTLTLDFVSGTYIRNRIILENSYTPSSSASFGVSGQIAIDSNYFYSHNGVKWRRTALSEW